MAVSTDHQTEKFQENILQVMGPLSRIPIGLENVQNKPYEAVEVPVDRFAWASDSSDEPSITINLVYILLKHLENSFERPP